jgi:hypothetical protein
VVAEARASRMVGGKYEVHFHQSELTAAEIAAGRPFSVSRAIFGRRLLRYRVPPNIRQAFKQLRPAEDQHHLGGRKGASRSGSHQKAEQKFRAGGKLNSCAKAGSPPGGFRQNRGVRVMSADALMKVQDLDGFEGYKDRTEGDNQPQAGGGVIQGAVVKFTNEATWVTRDGEELDPNLELLVVNVGRVVQKWWDQQPVETIVLAPGQKFPDLQKLNEQTPRNEWIKGPDGILRGPWQAQHIVYFLNPQTMDRYSFPTGTTGGAICVRDLVDKTNWMRRYRGAHVYPVVTLSDVFMNTRFGGRQRPHFLIKRFVNMGGEEKPLPATALALEQSTTEPAEKTAEAPAAKAEPSVTKPTRTTKRGVTRIDAPTVEPPTLKEELNDEIPI